MKGTRCATAWAIGLALLAARGAVACDLVGANTSIDVTVARTGVTAFTMTTRGARAVVRLGTDERERSLAAVTVDGHLAFTGTAESESLAIATRERVSLGDGIIQLVPGVDVTVLGTSKRGVFARLRLQGNDVAISRIELPCALLSLDPVEEPEGPTQEEEPTQRKQWVSRGSLLALSSRPSGRPITSMTIARPIEQPFEQLDAKPGWLKLRWHRYNGVVVAAWVRRSDVRPEPKDEGAARPGLRGRRASVACEPAKKLYVGRASIRPNTPVYAQPGRAPWALLRHDDDVEVSIVAEHDEWVAITNVPDLSGGEVCGDLTHLWIERRAVELPATAPPAPDFTGTWSDAPSYPGPLLASFTVTLLPTGSLILVGGRAGTVATSTALLFDPIHKRWSPTAPLRFARADHTATLLADGRLLVVGGDRTTPDATGGTTSEIYDPKTATWSTASERTLQRSGHAAVRLNDGRVLIAGGANRDDGGLHQTELFDPIAGTWTEVGRIVTPRAARSLTRLPDGRVLMAGGWQEPAPGAFACGNARMMWRPELVSTVEVFDPATLQWSTEKEELPRAHGNHTASLLGDGGVLIVDGWARGVDGALGSAAVERFDVAAAHWTMEGSGDPAYDAFVQRSVPARYDEMWARRRSGHTATRLLDGRILVVGGEMVGRPTSERAALYDPTTRQWRAGPSTKLARTNHVATLLPDGDVVIVGGIDRLAADARGSDGNTPTNRVEIFSLGH